MGKYDIAAFVWPSYHPAKRAKVFWPMGIWEWETVMKNKPKFEGHEQPRYLLWGYVNEAEDDVTAYMGYDNGESMVNITIYFNYGSNECLPREQANKNC